MSPKECDNRRQRDITFVSSHPSSLWTKEILTDLVFLKKQHEKDEVGNTIYRLTDWLTSTALLRLKQVEVLFHAEYFFPSLFLQISLIIFDYILKVFIYSFIHFLIYLFFSPFIFLVTDLFIYFIFFALCYFWPTLSYSALLYSILFKSVFHEVSRC